MNREVDEITKKLNVKNKKGEIAFEEAFKTKSLHRIYNLDYFLEKNSYFSRSEAQVQALYKAISNPEKFRTYLESLGLTESKFKRKKIIKKEVKEKARLEEQDFIKKRILLLI